ncbi:cupredoxin domain-containing protein [Streptomyces sp. NPDC046197]|uniref:cupredoxin domain-containing protein n=1 Tax=Streptomyces sp. NPDC046197 TaxID=3154337 RepID=UPI0033C175A4
MSRRFSRGGAMVGAGAVALAAVLTACGNPASSGTGGAAASTSSKGGQTVTVKMTEYQLALSSKTFKAGAYTFAVKNDGHTLHSLEIEGKGTEARLPHALQPGQSAQLKVTLKNGSYELYCPVDSHKSLGMKTEINVGGAGGGGTSSSGSGY